MRVSVATRFCDDGAPVFVTNLGPHHGWRIEELNWPGMYNGWEDSTLRLYWRDYPDSFSQLMH